MNTTIQNISSLDPYFTTISGDLTVTTKILTAQITDELDSSSIILNTGGINMASTSLNFNNHSVLSSTGTSSQYFMGDGSLLQFSANSGNSNFYLYKSKTGLSPNPLIGSITYNNNNQSLATFIHINHLTRDSIDIEVFFKQISTLSDVYIQDQMFAVNWIQYNITGTPTIVSGDKITIPVSLRTGGGQGLVNFPDYTDVLLSFFTNSIEADTRISGLETKTQYQSASANTTTFSGNGGIISDKLVKSGGLTTQFLKANGDIDSNNYAQGIATQTNWAVPYINSIGQISSGITNLYVQSGVTSIQTVVNALTSGQGYSIHLSAGNFTESVNLSRETYTLSGVDSPIYAPSTTITGSLTIGTAGILTSRIKVQDIILTSNLVIRSDAVYSGLRLYFSNCEFKSFVNLPQNAVAGSFIYFFDCEFSGTGQAFQFLNQSNYYMVFTRCNFAGSFSNANQIASLLTFRDCTGMVALTGIGICTLYGMNANYLGVSVLTTSSLTLAGSATSFVKGDGSLSTNIYTRLQLIGNSVGVNGSGETTISTTPTISGNWTWADSMVGSTKIIRLIGTISRTSAVSTTFTFRLKANGLTVISYTTGPSPATILAGGLFTIYECILEVNRFSATQITLTSTYEDIETQISPSALNRAFSSSTTNVPALGVSTVWSLTAQASSAGSAFNCKPYITSLLD